MPDITPRRAGVLFAMSSLARIPHRLRTRLLAAALLVVGGWAGWVAWERFRHGATFDSGMVQSFLEARFSTLSGGVYHVRLGPIHVDLAHDGARVDSAVITTDTVANARRAHPLPVIQVVLRDAQVRGVVRDADGKGIAIGEIRWGQADAVLTFAPTVPDTLTGRSATADAGPPIVSWTLELPPGAPQVRIARLILQGITAEVRPAPGSGGRVQRVEHLTVVLDSVRLDRRPEGIHMPFVVHDIRLLLADYRGGWDSVSTLAVEDLRGSFRDSSFRVEGASLQPVRSIAEVLRRGRPRRERYAVTVETADARGVDWARGVRDGALVARAVTLNGAFLDIFTDQRLAGRAAPRPRIPILQETVRRFGRPLDVDTVWLQHSRIRYQVHPPEGEEVGVMDLQSIDARLTGLVWLPDAPATGDARLRLTGRLWGAAPVDLSVRGPLGSSTPAAILDLRLGAMPLIAANALATAIGRIDIKQGQLDSAVVHLTFQGDGCVGEVRPYYHDLSVRLIAHGGFMSRLTGGARTVFANSFVVRDDNPGKDGRVMTGHVGRVRDPWQAFWPFAWACTRGGLSAIAAGRGAQDPH